MRRSAGWGLVLLLVVAACGWGSARAQASSPRGWTPAGPIHQTSAPARCPPSVLPVFMRAAGDTRVTTRIETSVGFVVCDYHARPVRAGRCGSVRVSVYSGPHAYMDFQRWVVETDQTASQSGIVTPGQRPVPVNGVGLEADWVAADRMLGAATPERWVTATLQCAISAAAGLTLATSLGRAALQ
jgi:hypothetical protein